MWLAFKRAKISMKGKLSLTNKDQTEQKENQQIQARISFRLTLITIEKAASFGAHRFFR